MSENQRRAELRGRMAELQREYSTVNAELKQMQAEDEAAANRAKYADYKFKIGTHGYQITGEEKVEEATDADREDAGVGSSGLVYTGFTDRSHWGYVMLKEKSDYSRVKKIFGLLWAADGLRNDKIREKEHFVKVLLGEEEPKMESGQNAD